jgi:hypothetical protein
MKNTTRDEWMQKRLYINERIVVFWLNDISVSPTTQRDGSYQNKSVYFML